MVVAHRQIDANRKDPPEDTHQAQKLNWPCTEGFGAGLLAGHSNFPVKHQICLESVVAVWFRGGGEGCCWLKM